MPGLRWDLTEFFPSLAAPEFAAAHESLAAQIDRLRALYDEHGVRASDEPDPQAVDEVLAATNELYDELRLVNAYIHSFVSTDARDDQAQSLASELRRLTAPLSPLRTRLDAWLASFDTAALLQASPTAADHAHTIRRASVAAAHQLSEGEEQLAAELNLSGGSAWNQLHGDVSSRLTAEVNGRSMPVTAVRNLAFDADPDVRRAAYEAELAAWDTVAVPLAACLNGVKGQASTLNRRRGWTDDLEPALFANAVERPVLEAMQSAVVQSLPDFERYLRAKARLLGHGGALPWWDLFAPVGDPRASAVDWDEATTVVADAFGSFSPALRGLAERAVANQWIDVEPRDGKRGGAFCMPVAADQSRVLLNFGGTIDGVSTLAHELGHAYHNTQLADRTALQRQTPMALAETASIFCETILIQSLLAATDDDARRLVILETDLQGACQVVVDIHSRFLFERAVFDQRAGRALSVAELRGLMTQAQRDAYGSGLDPDHLHPDMWAVKPHYYATAFYNWPYTYGLLFGIGLYARYLADPDRFRAGYDDLLSATGLGTAVELAQRFGIDVADEAFWTASLDVLRTRIDDFEALARTAG